MAPAKNNSDSEEDETFYYRYASAPTPAPALAATTSSKASKRHGGGGGGGGSGGLAPSKSTVYVGNLDYSLTNSDIFTIFSTFGKVAKVTVLKGRQPSQQRRSRGVAFVLFVSQEDARRAVREMQGKILNKRTIRVSIAADNGRAAEFIRRRDYKDKSRCYECGEGGHLSYECPRNQLGPRERPPPGKRGRREGGGGGSGRWRRQAAEEDEAEAEAEEEEGEEGFVDDNWASVVDGRGVGEREEVGGGGKRVEKVEKREKRSSYFSDESGEDD